MYLITPTLLNAFHYYRDFEANPEKEVPEAQQEADSRADFLRTLSREKFKPNENMLKGIHFENKIHAYCNGEIAEPDAVTKEIGDICKGGIWQQAIHKQLDNFLLYGKADVIKRDTIYDIKRTSSYDVGKFSESPQHRIYLYCTALPIFSYLASNEREWWPEIYHNHDGIEDELRAMISEFTGYLNNDAEAKELFYSRWESKQ
jgi:hypothetical protein